ncbi:MAG: hypothetical protein N3D17_00780 [bacterium]|nr:hypothetical protein [bacterium]
MFIDIHVHERKYQTFLRKGKATYSTPDQLLKRYDELGIEKDIILLLQNRQRKLS